jgi:hypothetical protein
MTTEQGIHTHAMICGAEKSLVKRLSIKIDLASEMPWMEKRFTTKVVTLGQIVGELTKEDFIGLAYPIGSSYDDSTMRWHALNMHGIHSWMVQ